MLHHNNPNFKFYDWHWFLLTGYTEFDGDFMVKAVTYGSGAGSTSTACGIHGAPQKGGLISTTVVLRIVHLKNLQLHRKAVYLEIFIS